MSTRIPETSRLSNPHRSRSLVTSSFGRPLMLPSANKLHTSTRVPHEPTTSGLSAHDDPKAISCFRTSAAGRHLRPSTGEDHRRHARGPCLGTEKPAEARRSRDDDPSRCCHPPRTPSGRTQAMTRGARSGACTLDLRGERTWKRSLGLRPEPISVRLPVTYCAFESSFPNRHARVIPAGKQNGSLAAFHGVRYPTTLAEAGSDLHRVCQTRLCCAFRFSQPLDALFRPQPLQPCFMPVTPLGFHFQRFSLPDSGIAFRRVLPFVPFLAAGQSVGQDGSCSNPAARMCALGKSVPSRPELPGYCRPILS
jgi:hypothetical protein